MIDYFSDAFAKNRSEEASEDNWSDFVVPRCINSLGIKTQTKALVIVGGRGCGKTTLLRYFCHPTQFSSRRPSVDEDDIRHIGLYWRADTNFLNSFAGGEQSASIWRSAFEHILACELGKEIIRSLHTLNCSFSRKEKFGELDHVDLSELQEFDSEIGSTLAHVELALQRSRIRLATWINNQDTDKHPRFLPARLFLETLIGALKKQISYLFNSNFAVFIDEYENLRVEQQRFINGLLKHGTAPLLFNIAMKRNSWQTRETLGHESIENISDYVEIDLEAELAKGFELFAAELLFFRLAEHNPKVTPYLPINPDYLRSVEKVSDRFDNSDYRQNVLREAGNILPRIREKEAAEIILQDNRLRQKLREKISGALAMRESVLDPELFIDERIPHASVIMPALISRPRENVQKLLIEFQEQLSGSENRLSLNNDTITNNLFGCVNQIYIDSQKNSILFSGFDALVLISRNNMRHFLELVHRIFKAHVRSDETSGPLPVISPEVQAAAMREASEALLDKIKGQGSCGPQMYVMAHCLGSIFRARHRAERQSEPETNHFTLNGGDMSDQLRDYLVEAEKWSVVFLEQETKMKSAGAASSDYILNPIYSPFFQISYRKKRSMPLRGEQVLMMFQGDQSARNQLVRELGMRAQEAQESDGQQGLFPEPR